MTPDQYQQALANYGGIAVIAQHNPEINAKLQEAIAHTWDAGRFERELWTTNWYKHLNQSQRALQVLQATDPAEYKAKINASAMSISTQAAQMGKQLSSAQTQALAQQYLAGGWDAQTLTAMIGEHYGNTSVNGAYTGQAGDVQNHVRSQLLAYGIPVNQTYLNQQVNDIVAGRQTSGGFDNQVIAQAAKLYPSYAQDFYEGRSLSDVAKPYMQQMGNTLEVDPSSITLQDKNIQKALQGDGKQPMPIWQFNETLKQDPRWQHTDNAKQSAYDVVAKIGQDWGFGT